MKNTFIAYMLISILLFCSCSNVNEKKSENISESQIEEVEDKNLITVEKFLEMTGVDADKYSNDTLKQFIDDYELTENNVGSFNIELLLKEYDTISSINDVSSIFDKSRNTRSNSFTSDVVAIAFYENKDMSTSSVYYDLKSNIRYRLEDGYVFSNINDVEPDEFDCSNLIIFLEENGVFSWNSISLSDEIEDGYFMELAVEYSDGSVFNVSAHVASTESISANYEAVRASLIN